MKTAQQQHKQPSEHEPAEQIPDTSEIEAEGESLMAELDALLDEIDDVLEENAEQFVSNYVQRGGE